MHTYNMIQLKKRIVDKLVVENQLRSLIKRLIVESDFKVGSEYDAQEVAAKERYEAAQADLVAWDDNQKKKEALFAKAKEMGVTPDTAKKRLKDNPQYTYDPKLAAKQRKTLEDALKKAEQEYSEYNAELRGYVRSKAPKAEKSFDKQLPPPKKKVYMSIDDVKPLKWYTWPKEVKKSGKSFGSAKAGAGSSGDEVGRTMGPGEEWLEFILGGQMQGGKVPYDIVTVDGRSWEVKALDGAGSMIRPGTEGRAAFAKPRKRLISIMTQIKNFVALARRPGFFEKGDLSESEANMISFVKVFVEDDYEMIVEKGEIGRDRFIAFRGILKSIQKFKHDHSGIDHDHGTAPVDTRISLNDKEVKVDKPTFIDVAKRVERATGDKSVLTGFEKFELLFSTLKDAAFDDPSEFFNEWFNSINIDNVFEHVDGVFIVNRNGFLMVPRSMFRKAFKFEIVSQGLPRFSLALPWGPLRKPISKLIQLFSSASVVCLLRMFQMASPSTPGGKFLTKEALSPAAK